MFFSHLDGVEGRLQFVQINSECGTVVDDPRLLVSFLHVPEERSVDADMGYLLSLIPTGLPVPQDKTPTASSGSFSCNSPRTCGYERQLGFATVP